MASSSVPARHRGNSLVQLLIVLLVLSVLVALSWPSLNALLGRLRAEALRGQLVSVMASARSTAVTRRQHVQACPSSDGVTCGSDWSHGWLLFPAAPPSDPQRLDTPWQVVQRTPGPASARGNRPRVHFRPDGRSGGNNLSIRICVGGQLHSRVVVSVPGRVRSERPTHPTGCAGG